MHPQLTYIIAQQRVEEMRAEAERSGPTAADPLVLPDGRRLKIRPIERQGRDRLRRLFMRLTPESRYRLDLSPKPGLELLASPPLAHHPAQTHRARVSRRASPPRQRRTCRWAGVFATLESRSARRRAPAPGCPLGRGRAARKSRATAGVSDMRQMTVGRDP
jgi:hypothetical protein